jgi:hypothetical protein
MVRHIVASRKSNHGYIKILDEFHDIGTQPITISEWMILLVDTPIHTTSQLFDEGTEQPLVSGTNYIIFRCMYNTFHEGSLLYEF